MKRDTFSAIVVAALAPCLGIKAEQPKPAPVTPSAPLTVKLPFEAPDLPVPKIGTKLLGPDPATVASFMKAHESFVKIAQEAKVELLFLGDSITAGWAENGKEAWSKGFSKYRAASFGIPGCFTQHLLWRIQNGELDGLKLKVAVVLIGTNNTQSPDPDTPEGISKGVAKVVASIREKQPQAKILLLAAFPRGEPPDGRLGAQHATLLEVNTNMARLDDGKHVFFLDIGGRFVQGKGPISKYIMPDFIHLSARGYWLWADAITPKITEWMER